jgi:hypothetical protein
MDRRLAGLVVLVVVLVAATALPGFSGRKVAGVPSAKVFPDPPSCRRLRALAAGRRGA